MLRPQETFRPIAAFYIFVFSVVSLLAILFMHLALVNEIDFFKNFSIDALIVFSILIVLILIPRNFKCLVGGKVMPIFKIILVFRVRSGGYEKLEENVYEQRRLRLEEDKKIKSNPFLYTLFIILIFLSIIGIAFLMFYSATGNFY